MTIPAEQSTKSTSSYQNTDTYQNLQTTPHNEVDRRVSGAADDALEDLNAQTGPMAGPPCWVMCLCCPCMILEAVFKSYCR